MQLANDPSCKSRQKTTDPLICATFGNESSLTTFTLPVLLINLAVKRPLLCTVPSGEPKNSMSPSNAALSHCNDPLDIEQVKCIVVLGQ